MRTERLGEFEELLLLAVQGVPGKAYGVPVQQYLERTTGRRVSMGAVYAALDRLEAKGLVRSAFGDPTPTRGGKRTRVFSVTPAGVRAARETRRIRDRLWRAIEEGN